MLAIILGAGTSLACGSQPRVDAVVESEQPFTIPQFDGDVCLAQIHVDVYRRHETRRHRMDWPDVVVAEGSHLVIGGERRPLEKSSEVVDSVRASMGWSYAVYRYAFEPSDPDRALPPDDLQRLVALDEHAYAYRTLLEIYCDGNYDCLPVERTGAERELRRVDWIVDVIRCGETFQWAVPEA